MKLLALDTATQQATVAVCTDTAVLAELRREVTTHSEGLLLLIEEALRRAGLGLAEVDAVVCGRGPGSFTGLRIGLATAKGLCLAAQKPLVCISSLYPLAAATREAVGEESPLVAAVLDARRHEVFWALYRGTELLGAEGLAAPETLIVELRRWQEPIWLSGNGALLYREPLLDGLDGLLRLAPEECHAISARYLARAAVPRLERGEVDDLAAAVPLYLRPSDARLPARVLALAGKPSG